MHKCISMLSESADWSVVRLYKASSHVSKGFEDFCYESFISYRIRVESFKLYINWDNWWLWGIVEQGVCGNNLFRRITCNNAFPRCPVPLYAQSPSSEVSIVQGIFGAFSSIPLIKIDNTVAYSLVLDLGIRWWFLNNKYAILGW